MLVGGVTVVVEELLSSSASAAETLLACDVMLNRRIKACLKLELRLCDEVDVCAVLPIADRWMVGGAAAAVADDKAEAAAVLPLVLVRLDDREVERCLWKELESTPCSNLGHVCPVAPPFIYCQPMSNKAPNWYHPSNKRQTDSEKPLDPNRPKLGTSRHFVD